MPAISFSGLASGIDGDAIIKTLIDSRRLASAPLETKVKNTTDENKSYEEFNTKLLTLNDTLKDFLTLAGGTVSKTATSSNEDAVTATAGANAVTSTTTFTVDRLATVASISFLDTFTNLTAPIAPGLAADTTLDITVGSGASAENLSIPVTSTTSVDSLVNAINNASTSGKVRATVVNVGTEAAPQYKLVVSSTRTGTDQGLLTVTPSADLAAQGVLQIGNIQQAENCQITLPSVGTVSRSSNQITDLIPGVTLNLKSAGNVTVTVGNDADKTAKRMNDMITAFNEVIKYSNENSKIERIQDEKKGYINKFGTLARTKVDDRAVETLKRALDQADSDVEGSTVRIFADLGITTEQDGTLKFDTDKFTKAVATDPAAVDRVIHGFADKVASTTGIIADYTRYQGVIEQASTRNEDEIKRINDRLARIDENLERQQQALKLTFAKLEEKTARLNSSSDALLSLFNSGKK